MDRADTSEKKENAKKTDEMGQEKTMESSQMKKMMTAEEVEVVCKKTRKPPDPVEWHGLRFLVNKHSFLRDGRYRTRVALCSPTKEKKIIQKVTVDATTLEELAVRKDAEIPILAQTNLDEIFEMIRTGEYRDARFGLYRALRYEFVRVKKKWAGKADEYDSLWDNVLSRRFEKIPIRELAFFERTKQEMDTLFNHAGHRKISEKEQKCWLQLSDFYDALVEDKIFPYNPVEKYATRYKHNMSADVLWNLSARSLSRKELLALVKACLDMENASLGTCMIIHVLLGLSIYELCGLNLNSWRRQDDLSWLEIERQYYQKRGEAPVMQAMLMSANQYRKVVCTDVVAWLLARQIQQRKAEGASKQDALFIENGKRLQPNALKKEEDRLLNQIMEDGVHIAMKGRGRPSRKSRDRARTDLFRGTAAYNFHYTSKMTQSQVALMCGVDRIHTYAIFYVDWNNLGVMRYMKRQLSVWHDEVLRVGKKQDVGVHMMPGGCDGLIIHGKAEPKAFMSLKAPCGMAGSITEV